MLQPRGALQTSRTARRKDTVCIQTCKRAMPGRCGDGAIVFARSRPANAGSSGIERFQPRSRLTAFRPARKIVRIRTKSPVAFPGGKFPRSPTCGGFAAEQSALCRLVSSLMLTDTTSVTAAGNADKIRCDACPVMCYIKPGAAGACDRYANHDGELVRVDPHIVLERTVSHGGRLVPFQAGGDWDGNVVRQPEVFVTAIGAGTTYPDYK